jgi:hypothetical protein
VRITLGSREHCDRMLTALHETLQEMGLTQGASRS